MGKRGENIGATKASKTTDAVDECWILVIILYEGRNILAKGKDMDNIQLWLSHYFFEVLENNLDQDELQLFTETTVEKGKKGKSNSPRETKKS